MLVPLPVRVMHNVLFTHFKQEQIMSTYFFSRYSAIVQVLCLSMPFSSVFRHLRTTFRSIPKSVTLTLWMTSNNPMTAISRYFTQSGSFRTRSQVRQIHWSHTLPHLTMSWLASLTCPLIVDCVRHHHTCCMHVPSVRLSTVGRRLFPVTGSVLWNALPPDVQSSPFLPVFVSDWRHFFSTSHCVRWYFDSFVIWYCITLSCTLK